MGFNCWDTQLGDEKMSERLDKFISTPGVSPLRELILTNNTLTQIPEQIRHFNQLSGLHLDSNPIR